MHLLYIIFGQNMANHLQARFSVFSFWADGRQVKTVNIITDAPALYASLVTHVHVIPVTAEILKEWRGEVDFFWRIKIKAIEQLCGLYPGEPVLYLDTDTFLFKPLSAVAAQVAAGQAFMHENEGALSQMKASTTRKMFAAIKGKSYGGITIDSNHCMWNAGVVLTPNTQQSRDMALALAICDEMCRQGVTRRLIEQFALSVALQESYGLQQASSAIAHYWSNKPQWNQAIADFLLAAGFKGLTVAETVNALYAFDFNMPVKMLQRNTNQRLKQMADRLFAPRHASYVQFGLTPKNTAV